MPPVVIEGVSVAGIHLAKNIPAQKGLTLSHPCRTMGSTKHPSGIEPTSIDRPRDHESRSRVAPLPAGQDAFRTQERWWRGRVPEGRLAVAIFAT